MWVVFQKSDNKVVGTSADSEVDPDKAVALEEVVKGLADAQSRKSYDAVQVPAGGLRELGHAIGAGHAFVRTGRNGEPRVVDETPEISLLLASTDARESHPVDGAALIPGDGESFVTIELSKVDEQGKPLERKRDNDTRSGCAPITAPCATTRAARRSGR